MWALVRCTARRTAASWWIFRRVCEARLSLDAFLSIMVRLLLLRFFQDDPLVRIADTLALVRLWRAVGTHFGRDLPDELLVQPLDHDLGLRGRLDLYALGHRVHHRVRETKREIQLVPLRLGAVADADQREAPFEALGHANHHVCGERAQGSRHSV